MNAPALVVRGVEKSFGATRALAGVDLAVRAGEVHAVLGENGAGKSTLMGVLAGLYRPDAGALELGGAAFAPRAPGEARARGVALVPQEPALCPDLSVAENIVLGVELVRLGFVRRAERRARAVRALAAVGAALDPDARAGTLSPPERALVGIARALAVEPLSLVILDEPTSTLATAEVEELFRAVARLRARGLAVLYISHFLEEVARIADSFTVLREGRSVAHGAMAETSLDAVVEHMLGRRLERAEAAAEARVPGEVVLRVLGVAGARLPTSASLELRRGEVLGVTGLVGSGRTELLRAVFGLDPVRRGAVKVAAFGSGRGRDGAREERALRGAAPWRRLLAGIGMASEDRQHEGLAGQMSVRDNLTLTRLEPFRRFGLLSDGRQRAAARRFMERLAIRAAGPDAPVASLSGGNQQKVALARLLHHEADVLLLDEPTRGIDLGSREAIYALVEELARRGTSVVWVSSQLGEVLRVCDRVCVMRRGVLGPARAVRELDEHALLLEAAT
ncbi:MAG: sugar ABC transporter ATP-binding protein [Myxococcales bacterium]|nr:sugar ABC transporter ATP-binding protein [Myxococcales bacterium]